MWHRWKLIRSVELFQAGEESSSGTFKLRGRVASGERCRQTSAFFRAQCGVNAEVSKVIAGQSGRLGQTVNKLFSEI